MATITISYDGRNTALKKAIELIIALGAKVKEEKPQYDPEFVKKIKEGQKEFEAGKCKVIKTDDLWK